MLSTRLSDYELVQLAREGDARALELVLQRLADELLPLALGLTAGSHEADVLLGDTLSRAYERLNQLQRADALLAWARRLMVRQFLDRRRWQRRRREVQLETAVVAYVGDRASAQDRALVEMVVAGIAPAPLPISGVVHDNWLALGPLASLVADQPVFGTLPSTVPVNYYVIRHGPGLLAHPMLFQTALGQWCPLTWDPASATFSCSGRSERWDRYGRALSPSTQDLDQYSTLVKDGCAYLQFGSLTGGPIRLPGQ